MGDACVEQDGSSLRPMPPLYRPPPPLPGKRPPHVLPRDLVVVADLGDDGWPVLLVIPTDAGLLLPCGMFHPLEAANEDRFGERATSEP